MVHEAFFRLVDVDVAWQNRVHFFAVSARVLRRVLVEHAKTRNRQKRGGGLQNVPLDEALMLGPDASEIVTDLDEALNRLALQCPAWFINAPSGLTPNCICGVGFLRRIDSRLRRVWRIGNVTFTPLSTQEDVDATPGWLFRPP
jgi:hypothetical protein